MSEQLSYPEFVQMQTAGLVFNNCFVLKYSQLKHNKQNIPASLFLLSGQSFHLLGVDILVYV